MNNQKLFDLLQQEHAIMATQGGNRESVIEEMADVTVVLSQVFMIEGLPSGCFAEKSTPADLWMLSGWLQTKAVQMGAVKEIQAVVKKKLLRLEKRMVE